ncbi:MAG TPA: nucleotidyl transferase AbiEii/AbiGii toxin family protein [Pyrinomonadaceae bacterium]|nr:nucleotidyl transferase AbiEii/AbiGii toxin family protein [Pyrinomonadaceae bacterium]
MTIKNLPASIHQRLLNIARDENRPFNELLKNFAIERFLFRLSQTKYREMFVLKGAQMLKIWSGNEVRPTMDIDLLGKTFNDAKDLIKIIGECLSLEIDDGVIFDSSSIETDVIRKETEYQGTSITAKGSLGKIRLYLQIDVGFGDVVVPSPVEIELPQLLDLGSPVLLGYTPESAIAEKYHAMVMLDLNNTRLKDFYDIWLLSRTVGLDKGILAEAIREVFVRRSTDLPSEPPTALTQIFANSEVKKEQWRMFLRKNRLDTQLSLEEVVQEVRSLIFP